MSSGTENQDEEESLSSIDKKNNNINNYINMRN